MKILYFTDPHSRGTNPKFRKDNFPTTLIRKIYSMNDFCVANDIKIDIVEIGGDVVDTADVSPSVINKFIDACNSFNVPVFVVPGNHDFYGYNYKSLDQTVLGTAFKTKGFVKPLLQDGILYDEGKTFLTGVPFHSELDKEDKSDYCPKTPDGVKCHVNCVHGFLTTHKWPDEVNYTLVQDIYEKAPKITLTGHEHNGFGVIAGIKHSNGKVEFYPLNTEAEKNRVKEITDVIEYKLFCNPGSLSRTSASESDYNRMPRFIIVDTEKISIDIYDVPIARPGEEILDRKKMLEEKQRKEKKEEYKQSIRVVSRKETVYDTLKRVCVENSVSDDIHEKCRERIEIEEAKGKK